MKDIERDCDLFVLIAIVLSLLFAVILASEMQTQQEAKLESTSLYWL